MGNICRSPTAEGVFRHMLEEAALAERIIVDSAGTHAYHVGERPDRRARRVKDRDFEDFDLLLAMDRDNLSLLVQQAEPEHHDKIRLFMDYAAARESEVPDPYYGGTNGFERVLDLVEDASRGLLRTLRSRRL